MKKTMSLIVALMFVNIIWAQTVTGFIYMGTARDANNEIVINKTINVRQSIIQNSENGQIIYTEEQSASTNQYGFFKVYVGNGNVSTGSFSSIDWSSDIYYLKVEIDDNSGNGYVLTELKQLFSVPYANYADYAENVFSGSWNDLDSVPDNLVQTLSINGTELSISDNNSVDLAGLNYWTDMSGNYYYDQGKVFIGSSDNSSDFDGVLKITGAAKFALQTTPSVLNPGLFYYKTDNTGSFFYVDNTGTEKSFSAVTETFTGYWSLYYNNYLEYSGDARFCKKLLIGYDAYPEYDFADNTVVFIDDNIIFYFDDTSNSGSFPSNDWKMKFSGDADYKESMSIVDNTYGTRPFVINTGVADNTFFIDENGNVGVGTSIPETKLDVDGGFTADFFVGNGSLLTGIDNSQFSSDYSNIGSVSVFADSDKDNVGDIIFKTNNVERMIISNNGNIGIGTTSPTVKLDVAGTTNSTGVDVSEVKINQQFYNIYDNAPSGTIDVSGNNVFIFYPTSLLFIYFQNGVEGQEITVINKGASLLVAYGVALNQYCSAKFICRKGSYQLLYYCQ